MVVLFAFLYLSRKKECLLLCISQPHSAGVQTGDGILTPTGKSRHQGLVRLCRICIAIASTRLRADQFIKPRAVCREHFGGQSVRPAEHFFPVSFTVLDVSVEKRTADH